jgi:hypothetical protein
VTGSVMNTEITTPPQIEPTPEWIELRRTHLVRELSHPPERAYEARLRATALSVRPGWRLIGLLAAIAVLLAAATLAVAGENPLDWLRAGGTSEARFAVDPSQTVDWPAPPELTCPTPAAGDFACAPGHGGRWVYSFFQRVEAQPKVTRAAWLTGLKDVERRGVITPTRAEEIRALVAAVDDEFFAKLDVLMRMQAVNATHEVRPGVARVPPEGIPQLVACRPGREGIVCHDLSAAIVPVGTPIYGLRENEDWVETPARRGNPYAGAGTLHAVFGRELTPAEKQLLLALSETVSDGEAGEGGGGATTTTTTEG